MDRFSFTALYLVVLTRRAANGGPLGYHVLCAGGEYRIVSPIGGGTVVYRTSAAAKLFDYARRTQLGSLIHEAEHFRIAAHEEAFQRAHRAEMDAVGALPEGAKPAQIDRCWALAAAADTARKALGEARDQAAA